MSHAIDQTRRLLSLVTHLRRHNGARVEDVARTFEISEEQLLADLQVLPFCGPSFRGGDLIDIETDGESIWWHNIDDLAPALRLSADEVVSLLVALRAVARLRGLSEADREAVHRAAAKLEEAAGDAAALAGRLAVTLEPKADVRAAVERALRQGRRLWLQYYTYGRDALTEREVDPIRLIDQGEHSYLRGWCHRAEDERSFRLDRVADVAVLDEPVRADRGVGEHLSEGLFRPDQELPRVVVEVTRAGRWVAEYYPPDEVEELPDGGLRIALRTPDPASMTRLALRLGADGRIVEPAGVADRAAELAGAALAQYDAVG
ncbi:helix-turn-helix transcriptional regulator [Allostreptomyces psammosilenae]|uniref:Proteasome accessory factor C n=1 Tax=Allostreptomyces psammosilenae TaxID=1892865 RepID=A0A852ZNG9_9ACTN|nr:WYL domain-containing protein [Allostreptomyces psammosilenae]NYI03996.1 proteasome accessory factor C [Allostreptomyces psammosilenae]